MLHYIYMHSGMGDGVMGKLGNRKSTSQMIGPINEHKVPPQPFINEIKQQRVKANINSLLLL